MNLGTVDSIDIHEVLAELDAAKGGRQIASGTTQAAIGNSGIGDPAAVIRAGGKRKLRGGSQGRKAQEKDPEPA
jgi:hypothetical protein